MPANDEVDRIVDAWERERPDLDFAPLQVLSRVGRLARHLERARRTAFGASELELWEFDVLSALRRAGHPYQLSPKALLQQTNLWEVRKKSLSTYSGGMKQRFGIAQALLASPRLIIVDEPTAGLDPAERNRFLNLLSSIGRDVTVILSTHIVDDVRELCPRMAIIAQGEVLLEGAPAEAIGSLDGQIWSRVLSSDDELRAIEAELKVVSSHLVAGQHEIRVFAPSSPGAGFRAVPSGLEDVYFLNVSRQARN